MTKRRWFVAIVVLLLAAAGVAWAAGWFGGDRALARVEQMRDELFRRDEDLSREQRRERFEAFRGEVERLSPEQREQLFADGRRRAEERFEQQLDEFFAMTPSERINEIDQRIDQMEEMRQRFEERRASGEGRRRREGDESDRGERGRGRRGPPGPDGAAGGDRRAGDWRGRFRGGTPEERNRRRSERLDQTSPKMRAMLTEYRRLMNERRKQRGMPEFGGRGGFGPPWGGPPGGFGGRSRGRGDGPRDRPPA